MSHDWILQSYSIILQCIFVTLHSSVQLLSRVQLFATPVLDCSMPEPPVHHQLPEFTQTHVHWVSDAIHNSSSVTPFSSRFQSSPLLGSFQMSQFFASGGQSTGVSASASILPMKIQDWFSLGWTDWISLQFKGLNNLLQTTVQKHQFFSAQLSL